MKNTKIIMLFLLLLSSSIHGASNDSINLSGEVDFTCEVNVDPEPIASNLDLTTSQSHLKILRVNIAANDVYDFTVDLPDEEKLVHQTVGTHFFSFDSVDYVNQNIIAGVAWDDSANGVPFPLSSINPMSTNEGSTFFWMDFYLNYTGVPALSLIQGTYSAQWHFSCGPQG